ncbi:PaaX family transcriptional regulator [Glaciibacter superstes]|uniref:PaaX family transcriptional regulator n=1 Tax=Glaciibacter superstes TaxID=501023 RepID=UPI0003B44023|nr:PaaX family transcriptional regulator C-terminal domain-containing protein [Glaciibacter superstes]
MTTVATPSAAQRQQHYILTIFGLYSRLDGKALQISHLIALLHALGVEDASIRSSVSRLKRRGVLVSTRAGGSAAYRLSPELEAVFREGDARIFAPRRATVADPWLLVSFSIPENERHLRHQLRTILTRLGCGQVSPGLWIATEQIFAELDSALERDGLREYVDLFLAGHVARGSTAAAIRRWWDLDALDRLYRDFVERWSAVARGMRDSPPDDEQFAAQIGLLTEWRRLPYLDPGIPLEHLSADWSGVTAEQLFLELFATLQPAAELFVESVTGHRAVSPAIGPSEQPMPATP